MIQKVRCKKPLLFNTGTRLQGGEIFHCFEKELTLNNRCLKVLEVMVQDEEVVIACDESGKWQNDDLFQEYFAVEG